MGEPVPETFRSFVARRFGAEGRAWLNALPARLEALARDWRLELGEELPGGTLAYVAAARGPDGPAVLKVAGPWSRPADEAAALRAWDGGPAPRLLAADGDALLLERIEPGTRAADAAADEVAALVRALHLRPPASLPPLPAAVGALLEAAVADGRATRDRAARALALAERLDGEAPARVLLHGDLDERNLLRCARRGLAAIDPLPSAGDPAYDAAFWAHANRRPGVRERRRAIAAALGLDPQRVRRWGEVIAVHG